MDTLHTELFLAYATALQGWRLIGPRPAALDGCARFEQASPPVLPSLKQAGADSLATPLHLLVPSRATRRATNLAVCHVCTSRLPVDAFACMQEGVYLSSPAFVFLQLAKKLDHASLVMLGYELCGSYSPSQSSHNGLWSHRPLTTKAQVERFVDAFSQPWPVSTARHALCDVIDGAASPMESIVAMLFTLPRRQGGYGLSHPALNYRIELSDAERRFTDRAYFVADLCWPEQRLVVEYDSNAHHAEAAERTGDSEKRNVLRGLGYDVVTLTATQVYDAHLFDRVASQIAKSLGTRIKPSHYNWEERCLALRRQLLGQRRPQ